MLPGAIKKDSVNLLRFDARENCNRRDREIFWNSRRFNKRCRGTLDRELKYLERLRKLTLREIDREQGRSLDALVEIFQSQCDIATERLQQEKKAFASSPPIYMPRVDASDHTFMLEEVVAMQNVKLPDFRGRDWLTEDAYSTEDESYPSKLPPRNRKFSDTQFRTSSGKKLRNNCKTIQPNIPARDIIKNNSFLRAATAPAKPPELQSYGKSIPTVVKSSMGNFLTMRSDNVLKRNENFPKCSSARPMSYYSLRKSSKLIRQRNEDIENFRKQYLVNALSSKLHLGSISSDTFAENDGIRKKMNAKKSCLDEWRLKYLRSRRSDLSTSKYKLDK